MMGLGPRRAALLLALTVGCGGPAESPPAPRELTVSAPAASPTTATPPDEVAALDTPAPEARPAEAPRALAPFIALDTHADTTQRLLDEAADLATRLPDGHVDLPRLREGGMTGVFMSIWVDPRRFAGELGWQRALALIESVERFVAAHPDEVALARSAEDVRAAHGAGRIAMLLGVEGAHALGVGETDVLLTRMDELAARGVRYVTLTWTNDNVFAHASTGAHPSRGLTEEGRRLVARLNDLGVMVDVSHTSDRTVRDAIAVSRAPVLASHSSARALADHPRNLPDTLLRAIGASGGAVCVNFYAHFLDPEYGAARRALEREHRAEFDALPEGRSWATARARNALARRLAPELHPPPLSLLVQHIAHVAQVAGPGAACLGSDFDGVSELPAGLPDVAAMPRLFEGLRGRGLDVAAIAGSNVLRVMESAARVADGAIDHVPLPTATTAPPR